MRTPLHILLVEDSTLDAELALARLADGGVAVKAVRVDTEQAFNRELQRGDLDLILSDFSLPQFTGAMALKIARKKRPELPFIFVSGALGEDTAVETLKDGATDYVLKQRLDRLVPAVRRAIAEAEDRAERKRVEEQLLIERKRAEEERDALLASERAARSEAERASRMKDEFLATLSHELRTPLSAIVAWAQILRIGKSTEKDFAEGLAVIERNAKAQARIIEDLLDMSRIISGKLRLNVKQVDLADLVAAAIEAVRPSTEAKQLQIQTLLDTSAGPVRGDPGRLQQVIWNLLSNAIKFTPKSGRIQVSLDRIESHVEIAVTDTGIGIKPEFLPHVFDRFRQADGSTTRMHGGLGLGLSIVKQLVELHGGSVRVTSDGENRGSRFVVHLPMPIVQSVEEIPETSTDRPLPEEADHDEDDCERPSLEGMRVLMVDDEPDAQDVVRRILEDCGAEVTTAGSVAEALAALERHLPDVLVSDIGMPGRDGYDLIRHVRAMAIEKGSALPAIALTAFARSEDRRRAMMAGFDLHIAKPVDPQELCMLVARLAGRNKPAGR